MDFIVIENCSVATTSGSCAIPLEIDDSPRVLETRYGSKKSFNGKHVKNLGKFKATTPSSVGKWESVMSDVPKPIATTPEKGVPPSQESSPPSKSSFNSSFKTGTEVGKTFFKDLLKVCTNEECCERIKIPGYSGSMPFLQAAESILSNFFGGTNHLELTGPVVFPPIIKKIGDQEQRGFAAEYEVYQELKNSKLPMYVFYSLKASHKNEELGDFILVTQSSVIILEVKAFSLAEPPSPKDLEILEKRLLNQYEDQRLRVVTILENYLLEHGWDKKSLPVKYFVLFANTKRPRQENMDFKNAIFKDNYMETITEISDSEKEVATKVETVYSIRTLLAWFYGTYASLSFIGPKTLIHHDSCRTRKDLDEEYTKNKNEIDGVFLTPAQMEIVACSQNYLQISGAPGTGKTYCLLAKMVRVFLKLWKKVESKPGKSTELIIYMNENTDLLDESRKSFWKSISKRIKIEDSMKKLAKFVSRADQVDLEDGSDQLEFDVPCHQIRVIPGEGKVFMLFLDDTVNFIYMRHLSNLIINSNFCWFTTYTVMPSLQTLLRPFNLLEIKDDLIYEKCKYASLTDTLRFTTNLHDLTDAILRTIDREEEDDLSTALTRIGRSDGYMSGIRVVGMPCDFHQVSSYVEMTDRVAATVEAYISTGKFSADEIAIIKISDDIEEYMQMFRQLNVDQFPPPLRQRLELFRNSKYSSITDHSFTESLRGREIECVIVCVLRKWHAERERKEFKERNLFNNLDDFQAKQAFQILEAVTRANSAVTMIYLNSNDQINIIKEKLYNKIPSVAPSNIYKKLFTSVMHEYQPQRLHSFLHGDVIKVMVIFYYLHKAYHSHEWVFCDECLSEEYIYHLNCDLGCIDRLKRDIITDTYSEAVSAFWDLYYLTLLIPHLAPLLDPTQQEKSKNDFCSHILKTKENQILTLLAPFLARFDSNIPERSDITTLKKENFDSFDWKYFNLCRVLKMCFDNDDVITLMCLGVFDLETEDMLVKILDFIRNYELLRKANLDIELNVSTWMKFVEENKD